MIFIIGGAYQGKTDFAREAFALTDADIYTCTGEEPDFSHRCIDNLENFTLACTQQGSDPTDYFRAHRAEWENCIFICRDMFCGVVPLDAQTRAWRQDTGRLTQYLSREAERVSRIFCGLEQRLK
jgi:adenosyl cobinamide kinase/adenosyl cobinamide phosphate guanylyltransferase